MLAIVAHCHVQLENQSKFEILMKDLVRYARRQEGCIYFDYGKLEDKDTEYIIIQKWATRTDFDAYLSDPNFATKALKLIALSEQFLGMESANILY